MESKQGQVEVWFGEIEFGRFFVGAPAEDNHDLIAIVHNICEKRYLYPHEIEDLANGSDWLAPSEYRGDIVFSRSFLRGLTR